MKLKSETVLAKNLWKKHQMSPNWLNERFKVMKTYKKCALIENKDKHRFYRNKVCLKKYSEREIDKQRSITKDQWKNKNEDKKSIYELPIENEGIITEPASSETNSDTEDSNPNLHEDGENNSQEKKPRK